MATWLERAKREISAMARWATANTAERSPTAVMAVHESDESEIFLGSFGSNGSTPREHFQETAAVAQITAGEELAIRAWLARMGENDEAIVDDVLTRCRADAGAVGYFIALSGEVRSPARFDDDRRRCDQCANLTERGLCLAARRGEIVAARVYQPIRDLLRRCEGYAPGPDELDRRSGRDRWPGLTQQGNDYANT